MAHIPLIPKEFFLKKYNIGLSDFEKTKIIWSDLENIYNDYYSELAELEPMAQFIVNRLNKIKKIHVAKYRIKEPEHLIEKLIRKKIEDNNFIFSVDDYKIKITDIIGVRALHLFKEDWLEINGELVSKFDLKEPPTAFVRTGDIKEYIEVFEKNGCAIKEHKNGYRSVHYLIDASMLKNKYTAEIQVRTIFEEGWSEIDHKIKYPYIKDNVILEKLLSILNRFAGSADELGSFIAYLQPELEKHNKKIIELNNTIDKLKIDKAEKDKLKQGVSDMGDVFTRVEFFPGLVATIKGMKDAQASVLSQIPRLTSMADGLKDAQSEAISHVAKMTETAKSNLELFKPYPGIGLSKGNGGDDKDNFPKL